MTDDSAELTTNGCAEALLVQHFLEGDAVACGNGLLAAAFGFARAKVKVPLAASLGRPEDLREDNQGHPHGSIQQTAQSSILRGSVMIWPAAPLSQRAARRVVTCAFIGGGNSLLHFSRRPVQIEL